SSRRRHTRFSRDWSSDVCSSDLVAGEALEERGERRMLMPQRLLQRHRRHLRQERQILGLLPLRESGVSRLVGGGFLFGGVALLPFGERLVPDQAYTAERAPQQGGLLGVRVGPDLVRGPHKINFTQEVTLCKRNTLVAYAIPPRRERRGILAVLR